jgi:hypothetical protein
VNEGSDRSGLGKEKVNNIFYLCLCVFVCVCVCLLITARTGSHCIMLEWVYPGKKYSTRKKRIEFC